MGVDALQGAIRQLDLDSPFVAVAKYHVEDRLFRSCIHSNGPLATLTTALNSNDQLLPLWMGEIRREPTIKYYKECIRVGGPTSRQEKVHKIGCFLGAR